MIQDPGQHGQVACSYSKSNKPTEHLVTARAQISTSPDMAVAETTAAAHAPLPAWIPTSGKAGADPPCQDQLTQSVQPGRGL